MYLYASLSLLPMYFYHCKAGCNMMLKIPHLGNCQSLSSLRPMAPRTLARMPCPRQQTATTAPTLYSYNTHTPNPNVNIVLYHWTGWPIFNNILGPGNELIIARTGNRTCPVVMIERYMNRTGTSWDDQRYLFCPILRTKKGKNLRQSGKISYTCLRELFIKKISDLGLAATLQFWTSQLKS